MFFSGTNKEHIQFNEESLWTGGLNPTGKWSPKNHDKNSFGSYQNFGDLYVEVAQGREKSSAYKRGLDIISGIHSCDFTQNGVNYQREAFVSQDAQCITLRYTANKKGQLKLNKGQTLYPFSARVK